MNVFEKVIGYDDIKEELLKIADMFNNPEGYKKIGAYIPRGIIIHGKPGMGKTLLANEFANVCNCNKIILRKNRNANDFINEIKRTFDEAKANAPCIVILDDMDKFVADEDSSEEYYAVQACIDEVVNEDVLVVATANDTRYMPRSLLRQGRFDFNYELSIVPKGVSEQIVRKQLRDGELLDSEIQMEDVIRMFSTSRPATIITVLNNCKISMHYRKTDKILKSMLIDAFLKKDGLCYDACNTEQCMINVAYHEAGHIVMRELIEPNTVSFAAVRVAENGISGIVYGSPKYDYYMGSRKSICESLAGMAAEEHKFGYITEGSSEDIIDVNTCLESNVDLGMYGFDIASSGMCRDNSRDLSNRCQQQIEAEKKRLYALTKKVLIDNWDFVEEVAKKLMESEALLYSDIQEIRKKYPNTEMVV